MILYLLGRSDPLVHDRIFEIGIRQSEGRILGFREKWRKVPLAAGEPNPGFAPLTVLVQSLLKALEKPVQCDSSWTSSTSCPRKPACKGLVLNPMP